jgi:membrane fusion protein (multidrug efflux system)
VPGTAVIGSADSPRVFVVSQGRVEERVVLTAESATGEVVLKKGVSAGERLIVSVNDAVRDGLRVR